MKVSDLKLDVAFCTAPAVVTKDTNMHWVQLTLGSDKVQSMVKALAEAGLLTISDKKLWKADKKTKKSFRTGAMRLTIVNLSYWITRELKKMPWF